MKITGLSPLYFDIETTGLCVQDEFVLAIASNEEGEVFDNVRDLFKYFNKKKGSKIIVGYNTDNYRGGFDFPFLRSISIIEGLDWPFSGWKHIDIYPLVQNHINTKHRTIKLPSKSSLNKDKLTKLAFANDIEYSTIDGTYEELMKKYGDGKDIDWLDYTKEKEKDFNDLQGAYIELFDPNEEEEYLDGKEVPKLYKENNLGEIAKHCNNDIRRLRTIAESIIPIIPDYYIERQIVTL